MQEHDWLSTNPESYTERLAQLSDNQMTAVLSIKYHLIHDGLYGNKFSSADVYDAVLDRGVLSYEDFRKLGK